MDAGRGVGAAGLWEAGGEGVGRGRGCGGQEAGAGLDPGLGQPLRGPVLPRPWALDPLARPSGCPQLPSPPAADPPPPPLPAPPATWAPPPRPFSPPGLGSAQAGRAFPSFSPTSSPSPLGPRARAQVPGTREGRPPWASGAVGTRLHAASPRNSEGHREAVSLSKTGGAPRRAKRGPAPPPRPPRLTPHQRTRPEKETLAGPQARRGAGQEWERNGTADTSPAGPRAPRAPPAAPGRRHLGQSAAQASRPSLPGQGAGHRSLPGVRCLVRVCVRVCVFLCV